MASKYRELIVWQKAFLLTEKIYLISRNFPKEEIYSFTDQIRRSAVSVLLILQNEVVDEVMLIMSGFSISQNDLVPN